jgi:hypothetical protein
LQKKLFFKEETLKYIALIAMIIDHLAVIFVGFYSPFYVFMRTIGRISAPIFCWFLVKGFHRTHNFTRYTNRLLIFAILAFYPFRFIFGQKLDMMFLFFFGLIFLQGIHRKDKLPLKVLEIVILVVGAYYCDYGIYGLAIIFSLDFIQKNKPLGIVFFISAVFANFFPNFNFENKRNILFAFATLVALVLVLIP